MGSYYITARQIRDIDNRMLAAVIAACGITDADDAVNLATHSCTVDTDAGELQLTLHPGFNHTLPSRGKVGLGGWVAARFTDPDTALETVPDVSRYSGKWNFHFGVTGTPERMADAIKAINPRNFRLRSRYWYPGATQEGIDAIASM